MTIKSQRDFGAGLMFTVVGGGFAYGATTYQVGDAARMGPGYFPLMLGVILALMGLAVLAKSFVHGSPDGDKIGAIAWRPLSFVLLANVVFGVLLVGLPSIGLPGMGLVVAIFGLTFIASLAGDDFRLKEVLILSAILSAGSYVAFVWALKLQFPVWPTFITG
ncbi:tripartite tricarboxylate transporter TctB family protein [Hydrogenophaga soli]